MPRGVEAAGVKRQGQDQPPRSIIVPQRRIADGNHAGAAHGGEGGIPQGPLCPGEFERRFLRVPQAEQVGPELEGLLNKFRNIGRKLRRQRLLHQVVGLRLAQSHQGGELREGGLQVVLRLAQQESAIL